MILKNLSFLLFLFLFLPGLSQAQLISGKVTDAQTGKPLKDASVVIVKDKLGTVTDEQGNYSLKTGPGKHMAEVRYVGYSPARKEVNLSAGEQIKLDFSLNTEIYEQEQVVVTANKTGMNRDNVPMNVSIINQLQIEQSSESNILPLISSQIPGLFVTERGITGFGLAGGSAGKISIRGVGGSEASFPVLLLIDGQPQFMGMMGHAIPDSYVSSDIEKVEVVKGPASILYGTNAMGGAINLITRRQKEEGLSFRARLMYGSFNTQKYNGSLGYRKNRLSILGSFNHDQTDGDRPNSDFRIDNGYIKLGYEISSHFLVDANASLSSFKAYDPGSVYHPNPSIYDNKSQWVDIERSNVYFTLSNRFDKVEGGLKAYYMSGIHDIYDGWNSNDENLGLSLYQGLRLMENNLISLGAEVKKYGGRGTAATLGARSGEWITVDEAGAYTIIQHTFIGKLTANAGIRYDNHSIFGGQWIPQFGVAFNATAQTNLKASVAKGFRNPSVRELYLFPPANAGLLPETMWNYELTLSQGFAKGRGNAEITVFTSEGDNLILVVPNPTPPPPFKNQNSGTFSHNGLEAEIKYRVIRKFNLNAGYSYLNMDTPKVASPEHQLHFGGNYHLGDFDLSANLHHVGNLYTKVAPADQMVKNSYTLLSSKVNYHLNRSVTLFVSGENLLNQEYQLQYGYPMPGTTMNAGINISL
jgi:outer membrane cobalamin receptor